MKLCRGWRLQHAAQVSAIALLLMAGAAAQDAKPAPAVNNGSVTASLNELQSEVHELKDLVQQLKQETTASRAEISKLRQELESDRAGLYAKLAPASGPEQSSLLPEGDSSQTDEIGRAHV